MKKILASILIGMIVLTGCGEPGGSRQDVNKTLVIGDKLQVNQPTPTDIAPLTGNILSGLERICTAIFRSMLKTLCWR